MDLRKIDVDKRENGGWVTDIPDWSDLRLKVRGINNADYRKLQAKLLETLPRQKRARGQIDPDELLRINLTLLTNTCLLDWENLNEPGGGPIPFSKETAHQLMFDPECEPFQEAVGFAARTVAETTDAAVEDALGKLVAALRWSLTWGPRAKPGGYIETLERYGEPLPEEYLDRPEIWPHLRFFWDAFMTLGTDRSVGMAEGPIPFSAVDRYARRYGIDDIDDFEVFLAIMRGLDTEFLTYRADTARKVQEMNAQFRKQDKPSKPLPQPLGREGD